MKLAEEVVDPDDIEMLQDLIVAAVNEAMRKVDEESGAAMSKLTGGLGGGIRGCSEMDYYSHEISRLIEEFSRLPGIGEQIRAAAGFPRDQYARGAGGVAGQVHPGRAQECPLL